ncbi:unnamed protein product [Protopolystoma xenopodis]|uniref:Uncharacterized protein n=1 Tax=Protopolystoma xenopodis TaxID=117903 RepID=A0A448WKI2_9PLAT|nr:unnamed protein product [Protopolystoma xenopodis]
MCMLPRCFKPCAHKSFCNPVDCRHQSRLVYIDAELRITCYGGIHCPRDKGIPPTTSSELARAAIYCRRHVNKRKLQFHFANLPQLLEDRSE